MAFVYNIGYDDALDYSHTTPAPICDTKLVHKLNFRVGMKDEERRTIRLSCMMQTRWCCAVLRCCCPR